MSVSVECGVLSVEYDSAVSGEPPVSNDAFTLGSSHTLLTILKSMSFWSPVQCVLTHGCFYRILLATIRDQGLCPCPRCLVSMSQTDKVGLVADVKTRTEKVRKYLVDAVGGPSTPLDYPLGELRLKGYSSQHRQFQRGLLG
jgi:hypothetical protein